MGKQKNRSSVLDVDQGLDVMRPEAEQLEAPSPEAEAEDGGAPRFILRGAASCTVGSFRFVKGQPVEVRDALVAERLRRSGLFEEM